MGTSTPDTAAQAAGVVLPAGVTAGPAVETSQTNGQGQIAQGVNLPLSTAAGGKLSVFIPYSTLSSVPAVQALIDAKLTPLLALPGQAV